MSTQDIVSCHPGVINTPVIWNQEIPSQGQDHAAQAAGMYSSRICNPQLAGATYPLTVSCWGRAPKPGSAECPGTTGSLAAARLPWQAPLCPGPDLHPSCLGTQQWERLGYFKQVMSVLPSLSLPILPEALITVAGWICQTKRANGLIDMIWQLICNLIILSSRTHYFLFITLLSSQVCCSRALRTTEHTFLSEKSQWGQEHRRAFCSGRQSSWVWAADLWL